MARQYHRADGATRPRLVAQGPVGFFSWTKSTDCVALVTWSGPALGGGPGGSMQHPLFQFIVPNDTSNVP